MATPSPKRLVTAIKKKDVESVLRLIADGLDCTKLVEQIPPIGWAICYNEPEILKLMLEAGCDVDVLDKSCSTPLQYCSAIRTEHLSDESSVRLAEILVVFGADVMACKNQSHLGAPLAMAKMRGKKKLAAFLKSKGALAFDIELIMCGKDPKPISGEFYYGVDDCNTIIEDVGSLGKLVLESVFPGKITIGHEEEKQFILKEDGSVNQKEIVWSV